MKESSRPPSAAPTSTHRWVSRQCDGRRPEICLHRRGFTFCSWGTRRRPPFVLQIHPSIHLQPTSWFLPPTRKRILCNASAQTLSEWAAFTWRMSFTFCVLLSMVLMCFRYLLVSFCLWSVCLLHKISHRLDEKPQPSAKAVRFSIQEIFFTHVMRGWKTGIIRGGKSRRSASFCVNMRIHQLPSRRNTTALFSPRDSQPRRKLNSKEVLWLSVVLRLELHLIRWYIFYTGVCAQTHSVEIHSWHVVKVGSEMCK